MRGKVKVAHATDSLEGITPAHAGKSKIVITCLIGGWDHPRACGEK